MSTAYGDTATIHVDAVTCGACHVWFGLERTMLQSLRMTGALFYCPNGHRVGWSENENARLKRDLQAARARASHLDDQLEAEKRSRAAIKGHLTRVQRRIANGVCPCCKRSFRQVRAHMESQHPAFVAELEQKREAVGA